MPKIPTLQLVGTNNHWSKVSLTFYHFKQHKLDSTIFWGEAGDTMPQRVN